MTDELETRVGRLRAEQTPTWIAVPSTRRPQAEVTAVAIAACRDCSEACTAGADACLAEAAVDELTGCGQALRDAADIAGVTARVLSRNATDPAVRRALLAACWSAARVAREYCHQYLPGHRHYAACSPACRRVEDACRELLERRA